MSPARAQRRTPTACRNGRSGQLAPVGPAVRQASRHDRRTGGRRWWSSDTSAVRVPRPATVDGPGGGRREVGMRDDEPAAGPLPYVEVTDEAYAAQAAAGFTVRREFEFAVLLSESMPAVRPLDHQHGGRGAVPGGRSSAAAPDPGYRTVLCECETDHPVAPLAGLRGCGAYWTLRLEVEALLRLAPRAARDRRRPAPRATAGRAAARRAGAGPRGGGGLAQRPRRPAGGTGRVQPDPRPHRRHHAGAALGCAGRHPAARRAGRGRGWGAGDCCARRTAR